MMHEDNVRVTNLETRIKSLDGFLIKLEIQVYEQSERIKQLEGQVESLLRSRSNSNAWMFDVIGPGSVEDDKIVHDFVKSKSSQKTKKLSTKR